MYKKIKKSSADFWKAARKETKKLQIENPGVDKAVKTSAVIGVVAAGAVAAPFIPAVTAAVGGAAALAGMGWAAQSAISRDMDKELKTWYNIAGQRVRSTKEYENHFHEEETKMLRLAIKMVNAKTDKERIRVEARIDAIREELTEYANDFKVVIVNKDNEKLSEPYKLLTNQELITQAQARTSHDIGLSTNDDKRAKIDRVKRPKPPQHSRP